MISQTDHKKITKTYLVKRIDEDFAITGKGESSFWKMAVELSDFIYPWEKGNAPFTSFKALHSNDWIYCLFKAYDRNINIYVDKNDKTEVGHSDRVEIFFAKDDALSPYYCLELDPLARIYDFRAEYYRKFDTAWSWPAGHLIVKAQRDVSEYTVEVAISKTSLQELEILNDGTLQAGLYRADCIELKGNKATFKWISWVMPDSETPDFHIPSSFGLLMLEN